jgi:hypothetical protein
MNEICLHDGDFELFIYSGVKCKKCGHEARFSDYGLPDDFAEIAKKIGSLKNRRVAAVILCTNPEKFEICNEPCSAGGIACEFKKTVWMKDV